jgi:WD40 repeat protein
MCRVVFLICCGLWANDAMTRWGYSSVIQSMAYDRGLVAVGLSDGNVEIREIISGGRVRGWKGHQTIVRALFFTSDGRLVSVSDDGFVKKWDVETGAEVWSRGVGIGRVVCVSELADGRLAVGGQDSSVRVLDGATGQEVMVCRRYAGLVRAVISLGDLNAGSLASGSSDWTIRVWASDGSLVRVVEVRKTVFSLSLSACGHFVAAGCGGWSVKLYWLPDWDQVWSVKAHLYVVLSVSWSPDGRFLASGSDDCTAMILSADSGATLRTLRGHTTYVYRVLFSQDGTKVLSGSLDKTVRVWRIFWPMERRVRALCAGLVVDERTDFDRDGLREVVWRMNRLWEVERQEGGDEDEDEYNEDEGDSEFEEEEGSEEDD